MRVLHAVEHLRPEGGGLPAAVLALASRQSRAGMDISILETSSRMLNAYESGVRLPPKVLSGGLSPTTRELLLNGRERNVPQAVHLHGIWNPHFPSLAAVCSALSVPYYVSPHGQLMPLLRRSDSLQKRLKKSIFTALAGRRVLAGARKIHAVTEQESFVLAALLGRSRHVEVIPNYLSEDIYDASTATRASNGPNPIAHKKILFMGRLDPRKGVHCLIKGFAAAKIERTWTLDICGRPDDPRYLTRLEQLVAIAGVKDRVTFRGLVQGPSRIESYLAASAICLPSVSEVFALTNLEAATLGRMVISTAASGVPFSENVGGLEVQVDEMEIARAISTLAAMSETEYSDRCMSLRSWAQRTASPEVLDSRWRGFLA